MLGNLRKYPENLFHHISNFKISHYGSTIFQVSDRPPSNFSSQLLRDLDVRAHAHAFSQRVINDWNKLEQIL